VVAVHACTTQSGAQMAQVSPLSMKPLLQTVDAVDVATEVGVLVGVGVAVEVSVSSDVGVGVPVSV
jgi:hypothetical protein